MDNVDKRFIRHIGYSTNSNDMYVQIIINNIYAILYDPLTLYYVNTFLSIVACIIIAWPKQRLYMSWQISVSLGQVRYFRIKTSNESTLMEI